MCDDDTLSAMT